MDYAGPGPDGAQPGGLERRHLRARTSSRSWAGRRTCSCRQTATSPARSTRVSRSRCCTGAQTPLVPSTRWPACTSPTTPRGRRHEPQATPAAVPAARIGAGHGAARASLDGDRTRGPRLRGGDPFAEVKNRIHLAIIEDLGRQLFTTDIDTAGLRANVVDEIRTRLARGDGHLARGPRAPDRGAQRRHPRPRPARATARRRHGLRDHGQRPRRRVDRARGHAAQDDRPLHRRVAAAAHHQQDGRRGGAARRRGPADGRCAPAGRQPHQRRDPAALAGGRAADDPQVRRRAPGHRQRSYGSARSRRRRPTCCAAAWRRG